MGQDFNYIMDQCLVSGEPFDWQYQDRAVLLVAKRAIHVDFPKKSLRKPFVTRRIGYNSLMTLKNRIVAAAAEVRKKGGRPQQVHLRPTDAIQLQYELLAEGGKVGKAVMQGGVCKAISNIFGLKIVWKSRRFSIV
jgi:hypothetical protein